MTVKVDYKKLVDLLSLGVGYAKMVNQDYEAWHDDYEGEHYMDRYQYEMMEETEDYIREAGEMMELLKNET